MGRYRLNLVGDSAHLTLVHSYLTQIIYSLGSIADLIEAINPANDDLQIFRCQDSGIEEQKEVRHIAIINGASSLTKVYDEKVRHEAVSLEKSCPNTQ